MIEKIAEKFNINDYARIDYFYNITNCLTVIEINALPALTPSTVLFHQALNDGMEPAEFFINLVEQQLQASLKVA